MLVCARMRESVLRVVRAIPPGLVMTYGEVALASGHPGAARRVGNILRGLQPEDGDVPWQRVVGSPGRVVTWRIGRGEEQKRLLELEGVTVSEGGRIDLREFGVSADQHFV